jgi:acyl carrier protein
MDRGGSSTEDGVKRGNLMELEQQIWKYLCDNVLYLDDGFEYSNDSSFIEEGLVDSTGIMEIVMYVQSAFGITVDQQEVTPDNFDSVNKLMAFIRSKQAVRFWAAN